MTRWLLVVLLICSEQLVFGSESFFDFNSNCQKAYKQLMALQLEDARLTLQEEIQVHPNNLIPTYLADYNDCLKLLFNGNSNDFALLKDNQQKRLDILEQGDKKSPWYRFCRANIQLHWALVHLRFGDNFKAATRFRKSFLLLKENNERFPNFEENTVLLGLEEAIAGAMPENYQWIGALFGVKGNVKKGVNEIVRYLNAHLDGDAALHEEAMIYYIYLKFYLLNAPDAAWKYLNGPQYKEQNNLLRSFVKANIALNFRKAEIAQKTLSNARLIKEYALYPIMHYEMAESMLLKLDFDCLQYYQQFIRTYKGEHFIKDAWMKMAWVAYLQNSQAQLLFNMIQIKNQGSAVTDADKQALRFAKESNRTLKPLLEVRLLIDGGFYKNALNKIQSIEKKQLNSIVSVLEYNFRYGRIFEELGQLEQALTFYTATINLGRSLKEYYAARATLHKGFIYERQGKKQEAITHYNDCLRMRNHDFQSSIDQLAKAGLNRLGN